MTSPVLDCTSADKFLPKTLSIKGIASSPDSYMASTVNPFSPPQSLFVIVRSWATSTNLRVKYPELAVLRAVSAKPFLAP